MLRMTGKSATGIVLGLLVVTGCTAEVADQVPYYNESLSWFSSSEYDPEVQAIREHISPPGEFLAPTAPAEGGASEGGNAEANPDAMSNSGVVPGDRYARTASGRVVYTSASSGMSVSVGSSQLGSGGTTANTGATTTSARAGGSSLPLVGIRNSVGPSVTWRASR